VEGEECGRRGRDVGEKVNLSLIVEEMPSLHAVPLLSTGYTHVPRMHVALLRQLPGGAHVTPTQGSRPTHTPPKQYVST
jgi:hypothetical protein